MGNRSMFVGMDVHKESIDVSIAEEGREGEVRHYGVIAATSRQSTSWSARFVRPSGGCISCMKPARVGLGSIAISPPAGKTVSSSVPR